MRIEIDNLSQLSLMCSPAHLLRIVSLFIAVGFACPAPAAARSLDTTQDAWRARLANAAVIRIRHLNALVMTYSVVRPQDIKQIWDEETSFSRGTSQFQQLNAIFSKISLTPAIEADARSGDFRYWISGFDVKGKLCVEVFIDGSIDYVLAGSKVLTLERQETMRRMLRSLAWEKRVQKQLAGRHGTKPRSFRHGDHQSPSKQKRVIHSAYPGNSAAALVARIGVANARSKQQPIQFLLSVLEERPNSGVLALQLILVNTSRVLQDLSKTGKISVTCKVGMPPLYMPGQYIGITRSLEPEIAALKLKPSKWVAQEIALQPELTAEEIAEISASCELGGVTYKTNTIYLSEKQEQ